MACVRQTAVEVADCSEADFSFISYSHRAVEVCTPVQFGPGVFYTHREEGGRHFGGSHC